MAKCAFGGRLFFFFFLEKQFITIAIYHSLRKANRFVFRHPFGWLELDLYLIDGFSKSIKPNFLSTLLLLALPGDP